jgi:amidase
MLTLDEYASFDAIGLAGLVRRGETSPEELLECALAALDAVNPRLNAVVTRMEGEARAALAAGLPPGPFRGVPFLLKDLGADYRGVPTTWGAPFRAGNVAAVDSELVARYKRAGLVAFGKTAVPELAMNWGMSSSLFGVTRNPWNLERNPGISSGGSAAAVAAGVVPMAHGNDGGGSIRVPASCTGTFGLKPTRHRNPVGPLVGDVWNGMVCDHALTRSVRDSAALLDATAGQEVGAFYTAPHQQRPFLGEVGRDPGRLKLAWTAAAPYGAPTHPDCVAALDSAVRLCTELGHIVEEAALPLPEDGWSAFETFLTAEYAAGVDEDPARLGRPLTADDFDGVIWEIIERGRRVTAVEAARAMRVLHGICRGLAGFFGRYDGLITPALAVPPITHTHFDMSALDVPGYWQGYLAYMPFTHPYNIGGQPAMSVPLHWSPDGLPIGVQFVAGVGEEATLFRLAAQLEAARPWAQRRPPVHAAVPHREVHR